MPPLQTQLEQGASRWDWLPWELQLVVINLAMRQGPRRLLPATLVGSPNFVHTGYFMGQPVWTFTYTCISVRQGMSVSKSLID